MANISQKWVGSLWVLIPFTKGYATKIYASKVAQLVDAPQKTVARNLEKLERLHLLDFNRVGKNKYYFLDFENESSFPLLQILESYQEINFLLEHPKLSFLLQELSKECGIVLFGSYAKGLAKKDSDVDLVLLSRKTKKIVHILQKYPFQVSAHYVDLPWLKKRLKEGWPLAQEIVKDHILFGEKEKVIKLFQRYSLR